MSEYTKSVSGFKITGEWCDVVKHGEQIAFALEELEIEDFDEDIQEYNDWRPKTSENVQNDINNKTAEKAMINENDTEKEANKPQEDMKRAGEKVIYSYKDLGEPEDVFKDWVDSIGYAARAFNVAARKSIRQVEKSIYKNVMTAISPYYFDNQLISANINRIGKNPHTYEFEVNINDDMLKSDVDEKLQEYGDNYDRWHISTSKNTEVSNFAEGVEHNNQSVEKDESSPNPMNT